MYVLFLEEEQIFNQDLTEIEKAELLLKQYNSLHLELEKHNPDLLKKPFIITLNKSDLYSDEQKKAIEDLFAKNDLDLLVFSAVTGDKLTDIQTEMVKLINHK